VQLTSPTIINPVFQAFLYCQTGRKSQLAITPLFGEFFVMMGIVDVAYSDNISILQQLGAAQHQARGSARQTTSLLHPTSGILRLLKQFSIAPAE
jgi:hypothetical protein